MKDENRDAGLGYVQIGWIARGMDDYRIDNYKEIFGRRQVRVLPKIYKTEQIARRYGKPRPVFVKVDCSEMLRESTSPIKNE